MTKISTGLLTKLKTLLPPNTQATIAVGLSGGADSVFLLELFLQAQAQGLCRVIAAHLNHGWPATADAEAAWCQNLCSQKNIPFVTDSATNYLIAKRHMGSQEAIGHKQRRLFFNSLLARGTADFIALGHHQDDQLETFFIRLARGTSLSGIHGMDEIDGQYLRPLLSTSKQEIFAYLAEHKISFFHDATNDQNVHLRNSIRNTLIPELSKCDHRFGDNILTAMKRLKQDNAFLDRLTASTFKQIFSSSTPHTAPLAQLLACDHELLRRIVLHWLIVARVPFTPSEGFLEEVIRFLKTAQGGSHRISQLYRVIKKNSRVWIENTVG
jgi:tRNA(Ile)-lysidine synthase